MIAAIKSEKVVKQKALLREGFLFFWALRKLVRPVAGRITGQVNTLNPIERIRAFHAVCRIRASNVSRFTSIVTVELLKISFGWKVSSAFRIEDAVLSKAPGLTIERLVLSALIL
ncbi:hypothetical protein ACT2FY_04910 [Paraburkholderia fungorum]|uniref:hypothetical protein n=1 Tax=Paraburkholderia fungorum TaxID=134537 RepID=UPI00402BC986